MEDVKSLQTFSSEGVIMWVLYKWKTTGLCNNNSNVRPSGPETFPYQHIADELGGDCATLSLEARRREVIGGLMILPVPVMQCADSLLLWYDSEAGFPHTGRGMVDCVWPASSMCGTLLHFLWFDLASV